MRAPDAWAMSGQCPTHLQQRRQLLQCGGVHCSVRHGLDPTTVACARVHRWLFPRRLCVGGRSARPRPLRTAAKRMATRRAT